MSLSAVYQGYVVPTFSLLPVVSGLAWYKKLGKALHALVIYLCIGLVINIWGIVLAQQGKNNLALLHFYTMFELVAVMWYYQRAFAAKWATLWTIIIMIVYPILCVVNFTFFQNIHQFNTYTRPLEAIIIIVFSGIYLGGEGKFEQKGTNHNSGRWVAWGFLLYFCSSLFLFTFSNVISHHVSKTLRYFIWDLHATFDLSMSIFFFIAIKNERGKR